MGFHKCVTGVTGEAIADDILVKLAVADRISSRAGLYDGTRAMADKSKGAGACIIIAKQPKALYTHCASHRLATSMCGEVL